MLFFLWWRFVGEEHMLKGVLEKAWPTVTPLGKSPSKPGKAACSCDPEAVISFLGLQETPAFNLSHLPLVLLGCCYRFALAKKAELPPFT